MKEVEDLKQKVEHSEEAVAVVAEKEKLIDTMGNQLSEKDKVIEKLMREVVHHKRQAENATGGSDIIAEKEKLIESLRAELEDKKKEIILQEEELTSRFKTIEELEARVMAEGGGGDQSEISNLRQALHDAHVTLETQQHEIGRLEGDVQQWIMSSEQLENLGQEAVREVTAQLEHSIHACREWQAKYDEQVQMREKAENELSSSEQKLAQLDSILKRLTSFGKKPT